MKFTVDKKNFENCLKKMLTKGQLTDVGKNEVQVKNSNVYITDNAISFVSKQYNGNVYFTNFTLDAENCEVGEFFIYNLEDFLKRVSKLKGKNVTVNCDEKVIIITDGKRKYTMQLNTHPLWQEPLKWFFDSYFYEKDGILKFTWNINDSVVEFTPWFHCEKSTELISFAKDNESDIGGLDLIIETDENLRIQTSNLSESISDVIDMVNIYEKKKLLVKYMIPILTSISGEIDVLYRETSKGNLRVIIKNEDNVWLIGN